MSKKKRDNTKFSWKSFLIMLATSLVVAALVVWLQFTVVREADINLMKILSNAFFVSSVLYIGCGLLLLISLGGTFIGLQFLGYTLVKKFSLTKKGFESRDKDFLTFKTEKEAEANESKGPNNLRMLFVGLINLAISLVFTWLFYVI